MDQFDPETGECDEPAPQTTAQAALAAAHDERRARAEEAKGVGLTGIYQRLAAAYKELPAVIKHNRLAKDKSGQRGDYTSYDAIVAIVRPILLRHGIIFKHRTRNAFQMGDGQSKTIWLPVITDLVDIESGQVIDCEIPIPVSRADPHALGAAFSYGKRYSLLGAIGGATGDAQEDDDAQSAMPRSIEDEGPADVLIRAMRATKSIDEYTKWRADNDKALARLSEDDFERVKVQALAHRSALIEGEADPPSENVEPQRGGRGKQKNNVDVVSAPRRTRERIAPTNEAGTA